MVVSDHDAHLSSACVRSRIAEATVIPDGAERAIDTAQLQVLAEFVRGLCDDQSLVDDKEHKFDLEGQLVPNPNHKKHLKCGSWRGGLEEYFSEIDMYEVVNLIVKPMTQGSTDEFPNGCSYVEIVADGPQLPDRFISHFWGEKFQLFIHSIQNYIVAQCLGNETTFWICSLANRQWSAAEELGSDVLRSPFYRALHRPTTKATVLLTTEDCQATCRIWCLFEMNESICRQGHGFDLCIGYPDGNTSIICTAGGQDRETDLPSLPQVMERLLDIRAERGKASNANDRRLILKRIEETMGFDEFNNTIRKRIARPALWQRAQNGNAIGVRELLTLAGSDAQELVHYSTQSGTAIHRAALEGHAAIVEEMLHAKGDANRRARLGQWTPLHVAAYRGHSAVVKVLLQALADVSILDNKARSAKDLAIRHGHRETGSLLEAKHAAVFLLNELRQKKDSSRQAGYAGQAVPEMPDSSCGDHIAQIELQRARSTGLHDAASSGQVAVVRRLLDAKANVNLQDDLSLSTALHAAVYSGRIEVVSMLIQAYADVDILDKEERTALDWANHYHKDKDDLLRLLAASQTPKAHHSLERSVAEGHGLERTVAKGPASPTLEKRSTTRW